jgi:hypothetical protein
MKKIISILTIVLLFAAGTFAQTATLSIGQVTASPGETVTIPVTVSSATPILAAEFNIGFNTNVLNSGTVSFVNFHTNFPGYEWITNTVDSVMYLNWVSSSLVPVTVTGNTVLFEIQCTYLEGSTNLNWLLSLLVNGSSQAISVNPVNGSVTPYVEPGITVKIADVTASAGSVVNIPVTISGASSGVSGTPILAAEFNIGFDANVLENIAFVNFNTELPEYEWITNTAGSVIYLNWVASDLTSVPLPDGTVMFEIQATYSGDVTELNWLLSLLVDGSSQAISTIALNGSVNPSSPSASVFNGTGNWSQANLWSNGVPGETTVATIASGLVTIDAAAFASKLTVNAGAALTVQNSGNLTVASDLSLLSTANDTPSGSMINNGVVSVAGQTYIQRWLSGGQNHFISTAVSGVTLNMLYNPANAGYFYKYYEPTKSWENLYQLTTPIEAAKGYALNYEADELVELHGSFHNNASYSPAISYTENKGGDDGWNLVGNPYTSALDWENADWAKTNLEGGIYFYDGTNYQTYNGGYGVPATASQFIPAMQGFFVKATLAGAALSIPKTAQVHSSQQYYKGNREVVNALRLKISNNSYSDETLIRFDADATAGFDANLDAYKLFGFNNNVPQLFTITSTYQTIDALKAPTTTIWDEVSVNLGFKTGNSGTFTIEASELASFATGQVNTIELYDNQTGVFVNLIENPVYSFQSGEGLNTSRFTVYFNRNITVIGENNMQTPEIYSMEKTIFIKNASGTAVIYSLGGQEVKRASLLGNTINTIHLSKGGMYVVKVMNGSDGSLVEKVYLR